MKTVCDFEQYKYSVLSCIMHVNSEKMVFY